MASTATQSQQQGNKLPVIGIVPSQNSTEKMVSFPERYAQAIVRAGGAPPFTSAFRRPARVRNAFSSY